MTPDKTTSWGTIHFESTRCISRSKISIVAGVRLQVVTYQPRGLMPIVPGKDRISKAVLFTAPTVLTIPSSETRTRLFSVVKAIALTDEPTGTRAIGRPA